MKAVYRAPGLMMAGHARAASVTGSIGVKLTIYSHCHIDGQSTTSAAFPATDCGRQVAAQPEVTQTMVSRDSETGRVSKLVTIEW